MYFIKLVCRPSHHEVRVESVALSRAFGRLFWVSLGRQASERAPLFPHTAPQCKPTTDPQPGKVPRVGGACPVQRLNPPQALLGRPGGVWGESRSSLPLWNLLQNRSPAGCASHTPHNIHIKVLPGNGRRECGEKRKEPFLSRTNSQLIAVKDFIEQKKTG